jgi:predicted Zn-dependent protease
MFQFIQTLLILGLFNDVSSTAYVMNHRMVGVTANDELERCGKKRSSAVLK